MPLPSFDELVDRVRAMLESRGTQAPGPRIVLGIAGSPGSGKTTLAAALADALNAERPGIAVHLPMDGFHLANATLSRLERADRKGAIETFDRWGFAAVLQRIRDDRAHTVYAPGFDRALEEPVAGQIAVEPHARVVVVEGNYLLVDDEPWNTLAFDETWFVEASEAERMRRLLARHIAGGRTPEQARAWVDAVDVPNARLIEATRGRAGQIVSGDASDVADADRRAARGACDCCTRARVEPDVLAR